MTKSNKTKKVIIMLVAFFTLLTSLPNLYKVDAEPLTTSEEEKCYDGVCFEGEVEGNSLKTYDNLIEELGITEGTKPTIERSGHEEVYDKYQEEISKGGMWLKFTDKKYTRDGKPRTFYVAKKPILKGISWNTLHTAGAVYGWDVIDENTGLPKTNSEKYKNIGSKGTGKYYKAKIITINGEKYIVRLLQGKTNYGGDVTNNKIWKWNGDNADSEWNRVMLPITKGYRFGSFTGDKSRIGNYAEQELTDGDMADWSKRNYRVQSAQYNWFGDLTLGSSNNWIYSGKNITGLGSSYQGQFNWVQEVVDSYDYRAHRGDNEIKRGAAFSHDYDLDGTVDYLGFRPVLEPLTTNTEEENCYDGACFEGEIEGNKLLSYDKLISNLGLENKGNKPSISENITKQYEGAKAINDQYQEELSNGGMWLKFTDKKYTRDGEPRTFYVAKKPILKSISWDDLHTAGAIYGWDTIDKMGRPKKNPEKYRNGSTDYKAKILTINGEKYIVRLLQGKTNYGGDVTNTKIWKWDEGNPNSEWNRVMLPITKGYRFGPGSNYREYAEQVLRDGDTSDYSKRSYKVKSASYNWFGDLNLGANIKFVYGNYPDIDNSGGGTGSNGQLNWVQGFSGSSDSRSYRGSGSSYYGASYSGSSFSYYDSIGMGFRPVLEPLNEKVQAKQTIKLNKTDPEGKPLAGVKFILNGDTYTTDSKGKVEIPVWKYPAGTLTLEEPEQTINGIKYSAKKIPLNKEESCYDGVCFEGEVEGNSLISHENLIKELGITEGTKPDIPRSGYEEIYDQYQEELSKGGMWLKFTDKKYTRDGKPRTFFVMKKPARQGVSWNTLHTAGAIYGWDVIDENTGLPKVNPEKYKNIGQYGTNKDYKAKILTINGEKYIVRLLQGKTNYGGDVKNTKTWQYNGENANSEWNRVMIPITKGYRFGSNTNSDNYIEKSLRDGDIEDYSIRSYKVQSAQYNWFGDLTLGAYQSWTYGNKSYNGLSSNYKGQYSWVQEYGEDSRYRSYRGNNDVSTGAAYSNSGNSGNTNGNQGVRLVLEPLTANN